MRYRFGSCEFDDAALTLVRDGSPVDAQPMVLSILSLLIANRTRVVSKDELVEAIWDGRIVSDMAISSRIAALRRAIGDTGGDQQLVRTIYGRGFRFQGEVTVVDAPAATVRQAAADNPAPLYAQVDDRPSIAVLPLRLIGVAGPHAGLALAIPDELINALSRLPWLFVLARGSTFQFPSYARSIDNVRMELSANYCLSGTLEVVGDRIELSLELADTASAAIVWSDRIRADLGEIHDVRADIVARVAATVEMELSAHEAAHVRMRDPASLNAWQSYHLGVSHVFTHGRQDFDAALAAFRQAAEMERDFARAHAGISMVHWFAATQRPNDFDDAHLAVMLDEAQRAWDLDPRDQFINLSMGRALWRTEKYDRAMPILERAITLAPSYSAGQSGVGTGLLLQREFRQAISYCDLAIALSPLDPMSFLPYSTKIVAQVGLGDFAGAAESADIVGTNPHLQVSFPFLAASIVGYHLAGRGESAKDTAKRFRTLFPQLDVAHYARLLGPQLGAVFNATLEHYGI